MSLERYFHSLILYGVNYTPEYEKNVISVLRSNFQICTSYQDDPTDTCMSGVGGAVWCSGETSKPIVYGLTSFGKSCESDGNPGVATNVAAFNGWIESHLERDESACEGPEEGHVACAPGICVESTVSDKYIVQYPGFICQDWIYNCYKNIIIIQKI